MSVEELSAQNAKLVIIYQLIVITGHPLSYTLPIKTIRHSEKNTHARTHGHTNTNPDVDIDIRVIMVMEVMEQWSYF